MKKVLIVILNYKTYEMTIELINELKHIDNNLFDIMIIDNHSPNDSASILKKYSKEHDCIFYENTINSGYASGNNIGIRYGIQNSYQYSLIMNNDLKIIDSNFIQVLINAIENDDIACVGPKIIDLDGNAVAPYLNRPSFFSLTLGIKKEKEFRKRYIDKPSYVYRLFGCCMLLRNSAMEVVDCMDESTFLYCEEEILAERLLKFGFKSYYCPKTSIIHMESSTVKKEGSRLTKNRIQPIMESMEIYLKKYRCFNILQVKICQLIRLLIILKRG